MGNRRTNNARDALPISRYQQVTFQTRYGESTRYRDTRTGRYIAERQVRSEIDRYVDAVGRSQARALSTSLRDGGISLAEWQTGMGQMIRDVHFANVAAASGGVRNMGPTERGRVGGWVARELKYLRGFTEDIAIGKQRLDGSLDRRSAMYAQAGRASYYDDKQAQAVAKNPSSRVMVRSIRSPGDSCNDCIELDGKWFYVDDSRYKSVGKRICLTSCRCAEEFATEEALDALDRR